jgi:transcriptional regulator with XRE-family HTH domain
MLGPNLNFASNESPEGSVSLDAIEAKLRVRRPGLFLHFGAIGARRALLARLTQLREEQGLSQHAVAVHIGTSQPAIARLEGGAADPRLSTLLRYASAIGIRLDWVAVDSLNTSSSSQHGRTDESSRVGIAFHRETVSHSGSIENIMRDVKDSTGHGLAPTRTINEEGSSENWLDEWIKVEEKPGTVADAPLNRQPKSIQQELIR